MPTNVVAYVRNYFERLAHACIFSMCTEIRDRSRGGDGKEGRSPNCILNGISNPAEHTLHRPWTDSFKPWIGGPVRGGKEMGA
jgi:hypothetical protein